MKRLLFFLVVFVLNFVGFSQVKSSWKALSTSQKLVLPKQGNDLGMNNQLLFVLNEAEFKQSMTALQSKTKTLKGIVVAIPNAEGKIEEFTVVESSNFTPELQSKYSEIRAYSGIGITDPRASISFSVSPEGVSTMVLRGDSGSEFIEQSDNDKSIYVLSSSKKRQKGILPLTCKTVDVVLNKDLVKKTADVKASNGVFKTMRLALSCTGEYTKYFGGTVNGALAAMNATITRVNGVFSRDLAVKLVMIDNSAIIYTDPATDPYSDAKAGVDGAWNTQLQTTLTSVIGDANYDIGHLFGASGGGGDAGCIGCVCVNPTTAEPQGKGSGFTSPSNGVPRGDLFDIDFVAHEMGHQLGANHTFSYDIEGAGVSVEPGSGSTIMGYAGITDYDVQDHSDDYFAYASIVQIQNNLNTKSCPVSTILTNQRPVVNAGLDYTIPKSTAFVLNGTATDPDGDTMTYCWEQNDSALALGGESSGSKSVAYATKPNGPNFRSFLPVSVTNRFFPAFSKVLGGQLVSAWEAVPSVARSLNFVFTARDNAALDSGQTNSDGMILTVDANRGPFAVTSQNVSDSSWVLGSAQTITWSVNGSDALVGSSNVNIKMSTDGGLTFSIVLAPNTPNDGSEVITAPLTAAKNCRILIEPTGNVFYAVNSKPFALGYAISTTCNAFDYTTGIPAVIPESTTAERTIDVPATTSEISDVNVNVKFTHTYISDVQIELVSPKGTVVKLFNNSCGSTNSSLDLTYDDSGVPLTCGMTTNQTVVPFGTLSAFNGENPSGTWVLRFRDTGVDDAGTLNSASVTICSSSYTTLATKHFEINDFVLYPNPNKGNFNIRFPSSNTTDIQVLVTDLSGRKIYDKKFANNGDFNQNIQLKNASVGTYIVTVIDGDRKNISKIIVR